MPDFFDKVKKSILFRADANARIGSGHIMRCLSVADAAADSGAYCLFASADDSFRPAIAERGHRQIILGTDYREMEPELPLMLRLLEEYQPSSLIVDSYYVTKPYLSALRERCGECSCTLVYLDDVMSFPYPCDILVNYNLFAPEKRSGYLSLYGDDASLAPQMLLGTAYAPLRREFQGLSARTVNAEAKSILISTGGSDPFHLALTLVEQILDQPELNTFRFHIILGAMNPDAAQIRRLSECAANIVLHQNVRAMEPLMSAADVAISAAGSALYELCATQTPTVTYILADNQIPLAEGFARRGIMRCAGDIRTTGTQALAESLLEEAVQLAGSYEERRESALRQRAIVDGGGAARLTAILLKK